MMNPAVAAIICVDSDSEKKKRMLEHGAKAAKADISLVIRSVLLLF